MAVRANGIACALSKPRQHRQRGVVEVPNGGQVSFNSLHIVRNNNFVPSSLHYCASAAATLLLCVILNAHLGDTVLGLATRWCACVRGHFLVVSADLSYNVVESIVDIDA